MIFTFTFPKRTEFETERNYFWEKYFTKSFLHRVNWKYIDYESDFNRIDVIYSPNTRLNIKGSINANIYHIIEVISDKITINKKCDNNNNVLRSSVSGFGWDGSP